ncbi:24617_t:CDS:2 [Gigaspora margarita]|uniref:24617_t:CDS:1 n=1 Tax=Gigaspora margarita TaxID=4874 RepID=A0ABN7VR42_GIGMA|nr:24617_t:CDS:2 [Gigaspora margarita]
MRYKRLWHIETREQPYQKIEKKEENGIVPIEVTREKEKNATAEQIEIEINPISEDTGGHTRLIVTNNKDRNAKERIKLGELYTLWDLPLNFNNTQKQTDTRQLVVTSYRQKTYKNYPRRERRRNSNKQEKA